MLFRIITIIFIGMFAYRVLSRFVLPIFHISSATSNRLKQMQDQMREMEQRMNNQTPKTRPKKDGDYIDYEEVR